MAEGKAMATLQGAVTKVEQDLSKVALLANTAIHDIDIERPDTGPELVSSAKVAIRRFKEKIEEVENRAKTVDKETERLALEQLVREKRKELAELNGRLRTINFQLQSTIESRSRLALTGEHDAQTVKKRVKDKQTAAKANSDITDSLLKTSRLMEEHLQRSHDTIETLANSSKGIVSTGDELQSMQGHIKSSHSLLTKYGRKELTDKFFVFLALVFFFATVLYIVKKRLWSSHSVDSVPTPPEYSSATLEL